VHETTGLRATYHYRCSPGSRFVHRGSRHARPPRGRGAPRRAPL